LRGLLDSYPERYAVGETYLATLEKTVSYCGPDKLHAAFSFDFTTLKSVLAMALQLYPWNPFGSCRRCAPGRKLLSLRTSGQPT
jgi:hypothetical protein